MWIEPLEQRRLLSAAPVLTTNVAGTVLTVDFDPAKATVNATLNRQHGKTLLDIYQGWQRVVEQRLDGGTLNGKLINVTSVRFNLAGVKNFALGENTTLGLNVTVDCQDGNDNVTLKDFDPTFTALGTGNNLVRALDPVGGLGDESFLGGTGTNVIFGCVRGSNTVFGSHTVTGTTVLFGGNGANHAYGDLGSTILIGGTGSNVYTTFPASSGTKTTKDYFFGTVAGYNVVEYHTGDILPTAYNVDDFVLDV